MQFVKGILKGSRMLAKTIKSERVAKIDLKNSIRIEIHSCSFEVDTRLYDRCCPA